MKRYKSLTEAYEYNTYNDIHKGERDKSKDTKQKSVTLYQVLTPRGNDAGHGVDLTIFRTRADAEKFIEDNYLGSDIDYGSIDQEHEMQIIEFQAQGVYT